MNALAEYGLTIFGQYVRWTELIGQIAAVAVVALAAKRTLWVWPVQILATIALFIVYADADLGGLRDRQLAILAISAYGWWAWWRHRRTVFGMPVRRASRTEWLVLSAALAAGTLGYGWYLQVSGGSWAPWPDAWIFVGSLVAFAAQGRGLVEFWFIWLAVDAVGVPLQLSSGLWFSASVYVVFAVLVVRGYLSWSRTAREAKRLRPSEN